MDYREKNEGAAFYQNLKLLMNLFQKAEKLLTPF